MPYYVYMLLTNHKRTYYSYVGYTNDLKRRLNYHNTSKGAKFTRGRSWKLIYKNSYDNKSSAIKNEYKLKKNRKKRLIIKNKFLKKLNLHK